MVKIIHTILSLASVKRLQPAFNAKRCIGIGMQETCEFAILMEDGGVIQGEDLEIVRVGN